MQWSDKKNQLYAFVDELRRREVFQTAGLYAVGAFLLTEILLAFIDRSPLSASTRALAGCILVSLFVGGFPIVLWLAWLFDLTRYGVVREKPRARGHGGAAISAMAAVIVTTGLALYVLNPCGFGRMIGIAVIPCSYHGAEEYDYQGPGISAELNYRLSHLPQLHVPDDSSVSYFSNRIVDPAELADALGIDSLVECAARLTDSRLSFNLQLYDTATGANAWSEEYTGQANDELLLIAQSFRDLVDVDAINVRVRVAARIAATHSSPTASHEAWSLFQRARQAEATGDVAMALNGYRKAAVIDPNFARAHASVARLLWRDAKSRDSEAGEMLDAARAHVQRALQAASPGAETLAMQRELMAPDDNEALHTEIIAIRPNYAEEYYWWSAWLERNGRMDEAETVLAKARSLDPSGAVQERYSEAGARQ